MSNFFFSLYIVVLFFKNRITETFLFLLVDYIDISFLRKCYSLSERYSFNNVHIYQK